MARFCKKHYEMIAQAIQDLCLSDDELDECGLAEVEQLRQSIAGEFAAMFKADSGLFQRDRFLNACKPGANVRAVTHFFPSCGQATKPRRSLQCVEVVEPKARQFDLECPVCGRQSEIACAEADPRVKCGDCLMDRVEVVEMVATERCV